MKRDLALPLLDSAVFPALAQQVNGHRLVYLDGAASKLMPRPVIEAVRDYQSRDHANVHRGVHTLSERATALFDEARETLRRFVNAASAQEIVFTRGATESLNMVARGLGERLAPGDEVIVSGLEHHANLVPWQMACARSGAVLRHIPVLDDGTLDELAFQSLLSPRAKVLALTEISNSLGTAVPVRDFVAKARHAGLITVVDGAQAVAHGRVDVRAIGCDFYAFSGHKMYGPTGIGVLYGRFEALDALPLWQGGGDMIETVTLQSFTSAALPSRLEAGTPNISGAVGLGAAARFLESLDRERLGELEAQLLRYLEDALARQPWIRVIAQGAPKVGAVSFVVDGVHAHDVGTVLDQFGVAVRVGHHCAMPVMQRFGVPATVRASLSLHNGAADIDALLAALQVAWERLS
ncbi:MAG TPA: cysteine desulfurase [Ramlibacter sp.]|nr:cysteine desulfurase [Ramlibacter sp.]